MSRRDRGTGTVFQRADGKWVGLLDVSDGRTKRRRIKRVRATKQAVKDALFDLTLKAKRTGQIHSKGLTVGAWLTQWLDSPSAQRRPSTERSYRQTVRDHILPWLEHRPLASLTVPILQGWLDDLVRHKRTPRVVHMARNVLRAALTHAVRFGHLEYNPALNLRPPRVAHRRSRTATPQELKRLIAVGDPWFRTWVLVTVALGLRRGESLGLRWSDIDLIQGTLKVQRAVLEKSQGGIGPPKTFTSARSYVLPPRVTEALTAHQARTKAALVRADARGVKKKRKKPARKPSPWVFTTRTNEPIQPRNLSRAFYRACEDAKIDPPLRIHDLRHTAGTILLNAGTDPKTIAAWLGHADVQTTLRIYTHTSPSLHLQAGQQMQRALPKPGSR